MRNTLQFEHWINGQKQVDKWVVGATSVEDAVGILSRENKGVFRLITEEMIEEKIKNERRNNSKRS